VPFRLGTTVASLVDDGRRVTVGFTDGSGTYDVVVGGRHPLGGP